MNNNNEEKDSMSEASTDQSSSLMWIEWFLTRKGSEFFCEVDPEYIEDRFNLQGLNQAVPHFFYAYKLITDSLDDEFEASIQAEIEIAAKHLYGLIHARYILTAAGQEKMLEKFKGYEFGTCPRVYCQGQVLRISHAKPVLPVGLSDIPGERSVKLFCPRCQDVYSTGSKRFENVDGAYFGTSFPHMFLFTYPGCVTQGVKEQYFPRIFGFKVHSYAQEIRSQQEIMRHMEKHYAQH